MARQERAYAGVGEGGGHLLFEMKHSALGRNDAPRSIARCLFSNYLLPECPGAAPREGSLLSLVRRASERSPDEVRSCPLRGRAILSRRGSASRISSGRECTNLICRTMILCGQWEFQTVWRSRVGSTARRRSGWTIVRGSRQSSAVTRENWFSCILPSFTRKKSSGCW